MSVEETKRARNRAYQKAYYERHREEVMARTAAANKANPQWAKKARKTFYEKNRTKMIESAKHYVRKSRGIPDPLYPAPDACENCHRKQEGKRLSIDHCHETGAFRGWLCDSCNLGLGKIGDTLEAARNLVKYLETIECRTKSQSPAPEPPSTLET